MGGIDWLHLPVARLELPTFMDTLNEARTTIPPAARVKTGHDALSDRNLPPPAGFIFHLSRCGSTLLSTLLNRSGAAACFSEPPALGDVLGPAWALAPESVRTAVFAGIVTALGEWGPVRASPYVIKFNSLAGLCLPMVAARFPAVPCVFVYRNPIEIMVSLMERRPGWQRPGLDPLALSLLSGLPPGKVREMGKVEFLARLLARIAERVLERLEETAGTGCVLINYNELPEAFQAKLLPHFGLAIPPDRLSVPATVSRIDVKDPSGKRLFLPDSARKRAAADAELHRMVADHLDAPYARLEAFRRTQLVR
jgi:hypothetical protein